MLSDRIATVRLYSMTGKRYSPQVGYNTNIRHKSQLYHLQTEDSGLDRPYITTHLFVDGGRIIATRKTDYSNLLEENNLEAIIRDLMKKQHKAMAIDLRDCVFDEKEHEQDQIERIAVDDQPARHFGFEMIESEDETPIAESTVVRSVVRSTVPKPKREVEPRAAALAVGKLSQNEGEQIAAIFAPEENEYLCPRRGFKRTVASSRNLLVLCPSCIGERVNDATVQWVGRVLPRATFRQWVCSMPFSLSYPENYDKKLYADILSGSASELSCWYKRRAKKFFGLRSVNEAHTVAVTLLPRFDSPSPLDVHPHMLAVDGVYLRDKASFHLAFHQLPEPTRQEIDSLVSRLAARVEKASRNRDGRVDEDNVDKEPQQLSLEYPVPSIYYEESVGEIERISNRVGPRCLRLLATPDALFGSPYAHLAKLHGVFTTHSLLKELDEARLEQTSHKPQQLELFEGNRAS